jgi:ferric-dicitrate binding protein FerR (iron transport regulator)
MSHHDWIWPTSEQLEREVAQSRLIARRDLERRRREGRRELLIDTIGALAFLTIAFFLIWAIVP